MYITRLETGTRCRWGKFSDPAVVRQEVHAHQPDGSVTLFRRNDTMTAEPLLPEFRVPVAELFQLPTATK
jgi:hypothetical protein